MPEDTMHCLDFESGKRGVFVRIVRIVTIVIIGAQNITYSTYHLTKLFSVY